MLYGFDELEFQILTVNRFGHKAGVYEVKPRPFAAFSFRLSGDARFEVEDRSIRSAVGDVLFLPADTGYKVEYSAGESIAVHLLRCNYREAEGIALRNAKAVERSFGELLENWGEKRSVHLAKAEVYGILHRIAADQRAAALSPALARCVSYLEEHAFAPDLRIEDVCRAGFMSTSGMQRAFWQCFGMSAKGYLTKLRMDRAFSLLAQSTRPVAEIAAACGFHDEKYFSRAFKAVFGHPPSHFRSLEK